MKRKHVSPFDRRANVIETITPTYHLVAADRKQNTSKPQSFAAAATVSDCTAIRERTMRNYAEVGEYHARNGQEARA